MGKLAPPQVLSYQISKQNHTDFCRASFPLRGTGAFYCRYFGIALEIYRCRSPPPFDSPVNHAWIEMEVHNAENQSSGTVSRCLYNGLFQRVWKYVIVRSTKERAYYKYVNGQSIKYTVKPALGMTKKNNPKIQYTIDFEVTPHQLRHTYITNLLYAGVDPKTVQYLAGWK